MSKEMSIETLEEKFDDLFMEIDKLSKDLYERNSVSLKQIYDSYEESKH